MAKFTIILPVYNVSQYISRCLNSCVQQTYSDLEIIIVDDCGEDDSIEKAKAWAEKYTFIKIIHHKSNLGTYHARRTGVEAACGDYVVFLDPDDELKPSTLGLLNKLTVTSPDILFFGVKQILKGEAHEGVFSVPEVNKIESILEVKRLLTWKGFFYGTPGKAYKKEVVKCAFDDLNVESVTRLVYGEDALLFAKVLSISKSLEYTREKLYLYHYEEGAITKSVDKSLITKNSQQLAYVISILSRQVKEKEIPNLIFKLIANRLRVDMLSLIVRTDAGVGRRALSHVKLVLLTKNIKPLVRLCFFMFTFGMK